jgi:hypothetical protein
MQIKHSLISFSADIFSRTSDISADVNLGNLGHPFIWGQKIPDRFSGIFAENQLFPMYWALQQVFSPDRLA